MPTASPTVSTPRSKKGIDSWISFRGMMVLFFFLNFLGYVERVVLSGGSQEVIPFVGRFVKENVNMYFGMLTSAFILGLSVSSILFGYYVTKFPPFHVVALASTISMFATLLSGLAPNYWVLLVSRVLSGVGEAAFQVVVPSFIDEHCESKKLGTAMAFLYAAIPIGTAVGFTASGYISSHYSWRLLYFIIAPLMIPCIIIIYLYPYVRNEKKNDPNKPTPTFLSALFQMIKSPFFLFTVFAESCSVFLCSAYTVFGNDLLIYLGMFPNASQSTIVFGALSCMGGVCGAILGGASLNRLTFPPKISDMGKFHAYSKEFLLFAIMALIALGLTAITLGLKYVFLFLFFLAFTGIFATNPSYTLLIMYSAEELYRPLALGVATILYHLFGDVPAPIIVGRFLDYMLTVVRVRRDAYVNTHYFILVQAFVQVLWITLVWIISKRHLKKNPDMVATIV